MPKAKTGSGSRRAIKVASERFTRAGSAEGSTIDLLRVHEVLADLIPITIDVVRARDLVAFTVDAFRCELRAGGVRVPALRAKRGEDARLVVHFTYQHLGELAVYEALRKGEKQTEYDELHPKEPAGKPRAHHDKPDRADARPDAPTRVLPSRATRLAFDVAQDEEIEFSIAGMLDALGRLPLRVAGVGAGGTLLDDEGPVLHLPGGVSAVLAASGVVLRRTAKKRDVPAVESAADLAGVMRNLRTVRSRQANAMGTAVTTAIDKLARDDETVTLDGIDVRVAPLAGHERLITEGRKMVRPAKQPYVSKPPDADQTAIEAPFRLVISPDKGAGWAHSNEPVAAAGAPQRVELWHTRLGRRPTNDKNVPVDGPTDDRPSEARIIRALWTRDRELRKDWAKSKVWKHDNEPFRMSLDSADRNMLVRQTSEGLRGRRRRIITPEPVQARALWLSTLGAWLDLHGKWKTEPYSDAEWASILSWDHVAPWGRDQYVRVVYPGYLFPFGHKAALVKITERKIKDAKAVDPDRPIVAGLYQRKFLVVGQPVRPYDTADLPFIELRVAPLVTPDLYPDPGGGQDSFFWPQVDGKDFRWTLHARDHEDRPVKLHTPLLWVAEHYATPDKPSEILSLHQAYDSSPFHVVAAHGQKVAFAKAAHSGDTTNEAAEIDFGGEARLGTARPYMRTANVALPAVQQLSPVQQPITIRYATTYVDDGGFGGTGNTGEVWAEVAGAIPNLEFGDNGASSKGAGGFVQPSLPIEGLSRLTGTVGDVAGMQTKSFNPEVFLGGLPKLFGLIPLVDILDLAGLDEAPKVIAEQLARVEGLLKDLERIQRTAQETAAAATKLAGQAKADAEKFAAKLEKAADAFVKAVESLLNAERAAIESAMPKLIEDLDELLPDFEKVAPTVGPRLREELRKYHRVLREVIQDAKLIEQVVRSLTGLDPSTVEARFHYEWRPKMKNWVVGGGTVLEVPADGFVLDVDGRASGKGEMSVEVLAELRDFTLNLLPGTELVRAHFDRIAFHSGSTGKSEIDVVFGGLEFVGILGFIETLKQVIPLDGFSDPPYVDVTPEKLKAGFTLALPNVAIGVFALSNISIGADLEVPFLGKSLTVGFDFCSRERPFTLQVTFIGGGGWFGLRVSPDGLDVLELGLEAGATLSVDFGVASGSISAMIGVYMRLEGKAGSLAGYFRLRGEVDVMGLISASIELYLELKYDMPTGKMTGSATITVEVEVLVFSGSVRIHAERRFAGSNGDPSFRQLMDVKKRATTSPAWSKYCSAFAEEIA